MVEETNLRKTKHNLYIFYSYVPVAIKSSAVTPDPKAVHELVPIIGVRHKPSFILETKVVDAKSAR